MLRDRRVSAHGLGAWVFAALLAGTNAAKAEKVPLGGRTATMGGAAVAAGNDSAMPYTNPAGLAGVPGDIFAVSASLYGYTRRTFSNSFFAPNGAHPAFGTVEETTDTIDSHSMLDLPSSVMYFKHLGEPGRGGYQLLGMSLTIPNRRRFDMVAVFDAALTDVNGSIQDTTTVAREFAEYDVGPTWAFGYADWFRGGVSAFAQYARTSLSWQMANRSEVAGGAAGGYADGKVARLGDSVAFLPVVGAQLRLVSSLWLGAAVAAPSVHLTGKESSVIGSAAVSTDPDTAAATSRVSHVTMTGAFQYTTPLRVTAGLAWDDRKKFSAAFDVSYFAARKGAVVTSGIQQVAESKTGEVSRHYRERVRVQSDLIQKLDAAGGVEFALSQSTALRLGGFTDFANIPELADRDSDLLVLRLNRFGATAGLGLRSGSFDTTLGAVYSRGTGLFAVGDSVSEAAMNQRRTIVTPISAWEDTIMLVFSGAVTAEEARSTMEKTIPVKVDLPTLSPSPATPRSQPPAAAPSGSASPPLPAPEPAPPTPPPAPEPTPPDPHAGETP